MMTRNQINEREQLEMLTIEQLVPHDQLVRKLDATLDFSFIYPLVKILIVFADAKEKHGIRWTTLRGLNKMSMQAMLTFAALNLKKLASWTWRAPAMELK